jgi:hypothetical protein
MNIYLYIIVFILICLIICFLIIYYYNNYILILDQHNLPDVKWPFINLKDENDKNINMLCIRGPLTSSEDINFFESCLKQNIKFIGCSSYVTFPGICDNIYGNCHQESDMIYNGKHYYDKSYVKGWLHCFKEPEKYIKNDIPKLLLSESDFSDNLNLKYNNEEKIYDFIIYCPSDDDCDSGWNYHNKNWELTKETIKELCNTFNQKGLLIGRDKCSIDINDKDNLENIGFLDFHKFIEKVKQSKYMVIPSYEDASPRTLTESLILDVPVLVYKNILGGWKYINQKTGSFYDENNMNTNISAFLKKLETFKPREYFFENHGVDKSGKQLKEFLQSINPELSNCNIVKFPIS